MKLISHFLSFLAIAVGIVTLISTTRSNRILTGEVLQLEAELGQMTIVDEDKVYVVAIEDPKIPAEVAAHVEKVWQFRVYLPSGYDFMSMSGNGRVSDQGVYLNGGSSSGWSSPRSEPSHKLLTVSLSQVEEHIECFRSFGGSSSTGSWNQLSVNMIRDGDLVIETLAVQGEPARVFDLNTILPMLKLYDPKTAKQQEVHGESITTFEGGILVLCPKSLEDDFDLLRRGQRPEGFDDAMIAEWQRP